MPVNYAEIKEFADKLSEKWYGLKNWISIKPKETGQFLFDWAGLRGIPGLYRLILCKPLNVKFDIIKETVNVHLKNDVILSIGKTGDLGQRLGDDHFCSNKRSGRLRCHLERLFPEDTINYRWLSKMIRDGIIKLEYIQIEEWWKRDLLEAYGRSLNACLFDLGIEH